MNKKFVFPVILLVLSIGIVGSFFYFRTKSSKTCDKLLAGYTENHACIITSYGSMIFELYTDAAPKSVEKFKNLANVENFYNGLEFYRVSKDFVVQGGFQDVAQKNAAGELSYDANYTKKSVLLQDKIDTEANFDKIELTDDEKKALVDAGFVSNPNLNSKRFEYGALSFANTGQPNTNSTEFFIVTDKNQNSDNMKALNGKYTYFGKIISGDDVLQKINSLKTDDFYRFASDSSHPVDVVQIFEVKVK
jgi:cyclophilin family peptidyl-prolyl cis-trans isomerase